MPYESPASAVFPCDYDRWRAERDAVYRFIFEQAWSEERGSFVQYPESSTIDSSLLMMPLVHFVAPTDPAWHGRLAAITSELHSDPLVYRYNTASTDDGVGGSEGTFLDLQLLTLRRPIADGTN